MYSQLLRLNSVRQIHCFCKQSFNQVSVNSLGENVTLKIPLFRTTQICRISTGNWRNKEVVLESDKDTVEVYKGSIGNHIYRVKAFSLMTSVFGIATQPLIVNRAVESGTHTAILVGVCSFIGIFTFITPILLHLITRKYILRLKYCPESDSYIATTYSFFLKDKVDVFKANDVVVPDIPGMLTTFEVKGKPYFVDKDGFIQFSHYKKIMGYDKPMDFKLASQEPIKKE